VDGIQVRRAVGSSVEAIPDMRVELEDIALEHAS
jgi:hypothetical protein